MLIFPESLGPFLLIYSHPLFDNIEICHCDKVHTDFPHKLSTNLCLTEVLGTQEADKADADLLNSKSLTRLV